MTLREISPTLNVFDVHQHYGPVPGWRSSAGRPAADLAADCAHRVQIMARHGIGQACLQPSSGYERPRGEADLRALNDAVGALADLDRAHFPVALGTVDLWLGEAAAAREAERALDEIGLQGLAWHHRLQGAYIDDPRMHPILERLAARGKIAAVHLFADSTFEAPWRLENLAEEHPGVTFLALDAFSSYDHACWMIRIARKHENILFDTAALTTSSNLLTQFVAEAGPERLLLGTNLYGAQQTDYYPAALYILLASQISSSDKETILGGNARRLFGI